MFGIELPIRDAEDGARLVRALGSHRYVKGRLHLVHAFAFAAAEGTHPDLANAAAWARAVVMREGSFGDLDLASRDERLWRPSTEAEIAALLSVFWSASPEGEIARDRLRAIFDDAALVHDEIRIPFDESAEDEIHPVLIDAGWELLSASELDPERHKGMVAALAEAGGVVAETGEPYLHELPAFGAAELLDATDRRGLIEDPFVLWAEGPAAYHDYLVRGICRAARLGEPA